MKKREKEKKNTTGTCVDPRAADFETDRKRKEKKKKKNRKRRSGNRTDRESRGGGEGVVAS